RYLQASAYPKEMIILIDKSGSMKGRSDILSNATAVEILNTLTDNDYFNVMLVSELFRLTYCILSNFMMKCLTIHKKTIELIQSV
ncbi:unnamed protein product, partial [Heterobilharzia americana]